MQIKYIDGPLAGMTLPVAPGLEETIRHHQFILCQETQVLHGASKPASRDVAGSHFTASVTHIYELWPGCADDGPDTFQGRFKKTTMFPSNIL